MQLALRIPSSICLILLQLQCFAGPRRIVEVITPAAAPADEPDPGDVEEGELPSAAAASSAFRVYFRVEGWGLIRLLMLLHTGKRPSCCRLQQPQVRCTFRTMFTADL